MDNSINKVSLAGMSNSDFQQMENDLSPRKFGITGKIWVALLLVIIGAGLIAYIRQLTYGLEVTAMRDFTSWGIYVSNFVFFVAISLVGALISAILKLSNASWSTPLTRIAEIIAVSAISFAGIIIIVDMGRPDRMLYLFTHGRLQSPIIWDVLVINTYLVISLLLLYLPLLPDLAHYKQNNNLPHWQRKLYGILDMKWKGLSGQYKSVHRSIAILAVVIIPVAFAIHTVTSWLFASTYRAGWDSTNLGAYFVSGAFMVGAACVIVAMYVIRRQYSLEKYITKDHFDKMGKLLVLLSLVYLYFNINEYLIPAYKMKTFEAIHLTEKFTGKFAPLFWAVQIGGLLIPAAIMLFRKGRLPLIITLVSIVIIIGAWFKRFLIVTPTLLHPFIPIQGVPESWKTYNPTIEEWLITAASLAGALLIMTILIRVFPVVSIWEMAGQQGVKIEEMKSNVKEDQKVIDEVSVS